MTIKELRQLSGMTQKAFAEYFKVSKRAVENWEGGQRQCPQYLLDLMEYKLKNEGIIKGETKMKYAIIDWKNGDRFEEIFETEEEAIRKADNEWERLSNHDKKCREQFAVMCGELDDDGCFDLDTAECVKTYK